MLPTELEVSFWFGEGFDLSAKIQWNAYGVFDDLRRQDGQTHIPVIPKIDDNYRAFGSSWQEFNG